MHEINLYWFSSDGKSVLRVCGRRELSVLSLNSNQTGPDCTGKSCHGLGNLLKNSIAMQLTISNTKYTNDTRALYIMCMNNFWSKRKVLHSISLTHTQSSIFHIFEFNGKWHMHAMMMTMMTRHEKELVWECCA